MTRNLTPAIDLIKAFEGLADGDTSTVILDPYLCPAGYWTIGWGHVVRDARGKMLKGKARAAEARAIYPHGITMEEADVLLRDDVRAFASALTRILRDTHLLASRNVALDQTINNNQYCALLSFCFNVGTAAFVRSTLFERLLTANHSDVPRQLMRWTRSGGKVLAGLKRRREAEARLWLTPEGSEWQIGRA